MAMNSVFRGAVSEIAASADLMDRGYYVYRALSPSSPTDLVIIDSNGQTAKVEVKTAHQNAGIYYFSLKGIRADIVAVVHRNKVFYTFWTERGSQFFAELAKKEPKIILSVEQINNSTSQPLPPAVPRRYDAFDPFFASRPKMEERVV